jgi:hypothetical protein
VSRFAQERMQQWCPDSSWTIAVWLVSH